MLVYSCQSLILQPDYIRFLHFLLAHYFNQLSNMFIIKRDINQQYLKIVDLHFVKSD